MKKQMYPLSECEEELMDMLWQLNRPMTSTEMLDEKWDRSWKDGYLKIMLRTLFRQGVLKEYGVKLVESKYLRQYEPAFSKEEYAAKIVTARVSRPEQVSKVVAALVKETGKANDAELIKRLQDIISQLQDG